MNTIVPGEQPAVEWKPKAYFIGALVGALLGLVASYLYARAAEEEGARDGGRPKQISTGEIVALSLAALGLIRQIAEMGRPSKKR